MRHLKKEGLFGATSVLLLYVLLLSSCSGIQPVAYQPPAKAAFEGVLEQNNKLTQVEKISIAPYYGPEEITFKDGFLYCGARKNKNLFLEEGVILKINLENKQTEVFCEMPGWVAGIEFDSKGNLIACVVGYGIYSVAPDGKSTLLTSENEKGEKHLIPNDVSIGDDDMIYFTNTSDKLSFSIKSMRKIIAESIPHGGLYQYNPAAKTTETLFKGLYTGNGVTISHKQNYLLIAEMGRYRLLKYWLSGARKGTTEVIAENLPGFANNITKAGNGTTYWLAFSTRRIDGIDKVHPYPGVKKVLMGIPVWMQPKQEKYGLLLEVDENGKILQSLHDPSGKMVPEISACTEYENTLYMGSDFLQHINVLPLQRRISGN